MKTTVRIFVAALAASLALVSCAKQDVIDNGNTDSVGGTRTIVLSFANASVKSELGEDGLTPNFVAGDVIKFSNGIDTPENCTIRVDDSGQASINTRLVGDLTAIYPATAAKMNGNDIEGIMVPTVQDGTFASANIFKASIDEDATSASFENQTAILRFYVDASIGVKSITVSSTAADIAYGSKTITVDPEGDVTLDAVTDDPGRRICYVSVLPVAESTDLTFSSVTTTQTTYPDNTVSRTVSSTTMEKNKMYNAFIPYYIDFGTAGKWAYCNIGAFLPEDYGEYFAFGDVVGQTPLTSGKGAFSTPFDWAHSPFNDGYSTQNYTAVYNNARILLNWPYKNLNPEYDAAHVNWSGTWRMPTDTELRELRDITDNAFIHDYLSAEISGHIFTSKTDSSKSIFFPAAGNGSDYDLKPGSCEYWTGVLDTQYTSYSSAYGLLSCDDITIVATCSIYCGLSVRPVSD